MSLYSWYYHKLKENPGFAYTHTRDMDRTTTALIACTAVLLVSYYTWFLLALVCNIKLIIQQNKSSIALFIISFTVHIMVICSFLLGRYSQHFANGGLQCFLIGFLNMYVYLLCFVNYPVYAQKPFESV